MKFRVRFKLRTLLITSAVLSVFFGMGISRWHQSREQGRRALALSFELGFVQKSPAVSMHQRVQVWYSGNLRWDGDEGRYKISYGSLDRQRRGVEAWVYGKLGRDFMESPTAVEIDCFNIGQSAITDEFIDQIRKLKSIKQIWMADRTGEKNGKGNDSSLVGPTNEDLAKLFPELIVASPQH